MSEKRPKVLLITGATGFIGSHLAKVALEAGFEVLTLTRRDWEGDPAVPVKNRFLGSLPSEIPAEAFSGVDTLVHLAALTERGSDELAEAVNVEGSRALLRLAREHGLSKSILLSTPSARRDGPSSYSRTKAAAEEIFLDAPPPATILRPGLVYGPGDRGLFARMRRTVRRLPVLPCLGSGQVPLQPIHVEDLATAILRCVMPGPTDGRVFHLGAPEPVPLIDFLRYLSQTECGRSKPVLRLPVEPLIPIATLCERWKLPIPFTSDNLRGLRIAEQMECAADLEDLGLALRPLDLAIVDQAEEISGRPLPRTASRIYSPADRSKP